MRSPRPAFVQVDIDTKAAYQTKRIKRTIFNRSSIQSSLLVVTPRPRTCLWQSIFGQFLDSHPLVPCRLIMWTRSTGTIAVNMACCLCWAEICELVVVRVPTLLNDHKTVPEYCCTYCTKGAVGPESEEWHLIMG